MNKTIFNILAVAFTVWLCGFLLFIFKQVISMNEEIHKIEQEIEKIQKSDSLNSNELELKI